MWFFSSRKPRPKSPKRPLRSSYRPRLEALENRLVPASLSYSTFLNGTVFATAVDSAGDVYITGSSSNLQTTPGAFETSGTGASVAKLNPTGTAVLYATYLGNGNFGRGAGTGIAVDAAGDAYVIASQANVPSTTNAITSQHDTGPGSGTEDCVVELNPNGSGLIYSTYLPSTLNFGVTLGYCGAIAVDGSGNIDVAGAAGAGFLVTAGAYQTAYLGGSGGNNAFFAKINPALSGSASLLYATYLGGNGGVGDQASGIALDGAGNAYLTGVTSSTNFPTTSGAVQRTNSGNVDAFVAKVNPALSGAASLVYSTYLGGSGADGYVSSGNAIDNTQTDGGIAVDSAGNAYVTGSTASTNFPTTSGAFQVKSGLASNGGIGPNTSSDVFVTKLNATGTALVYSTYLGGGSTRSGGAAIALDANGDAYLTGWTNSTAFPTKNPIQATNAGGFEAFVTTLNPSGLSLLFSTYLGGSGSDFGFGIALDSVGNVYVAGEAGSSNFPTTTGAYQTTPEQRLRLQDHSHRVPSFVQRHRLPLTTTAGVAGTFTVTARAPTATSSPVTPVRSTSPAAIATRYCRPTTRSPPPIRACIPSALRSSRPAARGSRPPTRQTAWPARNPASRSPRRRPAR